MFPNLPKNLPATIPTQFTQGGRCSPSVSITQCNAPDNPMTQCLTAEERLWKQITSNPGFQLRKYPARYWQLKSLPFDEMPPDALRLNAPNAPGLPFSSVTTAGNYYLVFAYQVPAGYDGVINVTVNKFVPQTGPSYQDGSGQLTWALGINNTLAVNYTQIHLSLGSTESLGPVTKGGGIRVKANDLIQYFVSASAPAIAGGLDPSGIVVCAIQGWLYPSR